MKSEQGFLKLPLALVGDLVAWWKATGVRGMLIGGAAVSLVGRPRVTRDIDALVLVDEGRWKAFLAAGEGFKFVPRVNEALAFARRARTLLVRHKPSVIDVDISLGALPFEKEAVSRAVLVDAGGLQVPVPTAEDLIIMKAVAQRPRDLADVEGILDAQPKLDLRRVRRWVRQFASALERPDIVADLERLIAKRPKTRSRRKKR